MTLILASSSPRRQELLRQIGVSFRVHPADIDETPLTNECPEEYVSRLAQEKARHVAGDSSCVVLAADTSVVCNRCILGKPVDRDDGLSMLRRLSGQAHEVCTGIAVVSGKRVEHQVVTTRVWFHEQSDDTLNQYWATGESLDKAGAYGIQGKGAVLVDRIEGSYSNVVGLPLAETAAMLRRFGILIWQ